MPEGYLKNYVDHTLKILIKKYPNIKGLNLNLTKVDNQGFVLNLTGVYTGISLKSWWTGLSLYYCTEKICEDFLSKVMVISQNSQKLKSQNYKSYPLDSFGFPQNT